MMPRSQSALGGDERVDNPLGLHEVTGHDDEVVEVPRVLSGRRVEERSVHLDALDVESLRQLPLPLGTEIGRGDDEHPVGGPPELKLLDVEARHDRLARTGVVSQEEPKAGLIEEVAVNRFELMGQRHDVRDGQRRHVVLESDLDAGGLDPEPEALGVAGERQPLLALHQLHSDQVIEGERHLTEAAVVIPVHDGPELAAGRTLGLDQHNLTSVAWELDLGVRHERVRTSGQRTLSCSIGLADPPLPSALTGS